MMNSHVYEALSSQEYRSPYLGGQRLLIPDIVSCLSDSRTILIPFAGGHDLPWYIHKIWPEKRLIVSDLCELSNKIGLLLTKEHGTPRELKMLFKKISSISLFPSYWNLPRNCRIPDAYPCLHVDAFHQVANQYFDGIYFGTPTILPDNRCFFHSYLTEQERNRPGFDWSVDTEPIRVQEIMGILRDRKIPLVVSGFGTGMVQIATRMKILKRFYPKTKLVSYKKFDGFSDYVMRSEL